MMLVWFRTRSGMRLILSILSQYTPKKYSRFYGREYFSQNLAKQSDRLFLGLPISDLVQVARVGSPSSVYTPRDDYLRPQCEVIDWSINIISEIVRIASDKCHIKYMTNVTCII